MLHKKITPLAVPLIVIVMVIAFFNPQLQAGSDNANTSSDLTEPVLLPTDAKSTPLETLAGQDESGSGPILPASAYPMNPLYPDALDPPETCGVPLRAPFGQDAELLLVDSTGLSHLDHSPLWKPQEPLLGLFGSVAKPETEISAVALNSGEIFAAWRKSSTEPPDNDIVHSIWTGSWHAATGAWLVPEDDRGKPAALALGSNLGFFIRERTGIYCKDYGQAEWAGKWLPGLVGTASPASDPAVVSKDHKHVAVFYLDSQGGVWFTERYGFGLICTEGHWRQEPVSLSGAKIIRQIHLPIISSGKSTSQSKTINGPAEASSPNQLAGTPPFTLASELSAVSRNENHLAVFGVNADKELWVKEWTNLNESDWRDTKWVKLMDNVVIERPAVASRHSNHLGVAVRDAATGQAWYREWSSKDKWKERVPLGNGVSGSLTSPLTLAATAKDAMSLFTVQQGAISYRKWTEKAGWQPWAAIADTPVYDPQTLTAVVRGPNDVMLIGKDPAGYGMTKHFTSLGENLNASQITPPVETTGYRGQSLAWVDGEMLFAAANTSGDHWKVDIRSLVDGDTFTLDLPAHSLSVDNTADHAMAAGDLDLDGDDEIVFVSTPQIFNQWKVDISVLNIEVSPTLAAETIESISLTIPPMAEPLGPTILWDVNVTIGDLDGDAAKNEVVVAFYPYCFQEPACWANRHVVVVLFEFDPQAMQLVHRYEKIIFETDLGCTAGIENSARYCQVEDLEIAIGKVNQKDTKERLIIGDLLFRDYYYGTGNEHWKENSFLRIFELDGSWELITTDNDLWESDWAFLAKIHDPYNPPIDHGEHITLETGDLDADGIEEIAHLGDGRDKSTLYILELDGASEPVEVDSLGLAGQYSWSDPKMAVGDLNQDGRADIALVPPEIHFFSPISVYELIGGKLQESGTPLLNPDYHNVLIGDLDNDSFLADLVGCDTVREVSVVAVLNSAPRWYKAGNPIQDISAEYAQSSTQGEQETDGTSTTVGGSLSIGVEVETSIPLGGPTFGYRASIENETMASMGVSHSQETSSTEVIGFELEGSEGMVIFNEFLYNCYYYDVYAPADPENKTRAMACQPIDCGPEGCVEQARTLAHWHSPGFKASAGGSWVDVGHQSGAGVLTNLVTTYPDKLPIDPETLKRKKTGPIKVPYNLDSGLSAFWSISEGVGGAQENTRSFENNTTVSQGVTAGYVTVDSSVTFGFGGESSRGVSWNEELSIKTGVEYFSDSSFQCYDAWPYLYHARARTLAGGSYPYLELGWYVPDIYNCN